MSDFAECPKCGEEVDVTDLRVDGCLDRGHETACESCEEPLRITAVDWDATVYFESAAPTIPTSKEGE
jgi:hypothetical protein